MVLDATVAGASANSYLTVAAADAFAASDLGRNRDAWTTATADDKEAALIRATQEIDDEVGRVTAPLTETQVLLFPRLVDQVSGAGFIPTRVGRAVYLQAAHLLRNSKVLDDAAAFRARGLSSFANPDGTGGTLADDENYGRLAPGVRRLLGEFTEGAVIATIVTT